MTPLDTLRAALELVEQQLAAATTGAGTWWEDEGLSSWSVRSGAGPICADAMPDDATLMVTGVNLLPVVRDILADAIKAGTGWQGFFDRATTYYAPDDYFQDYHPDALRLARAIVKDGDLT